MRKKPRFPRMANGAAKCAALLMVSLLLAGEAQGYVLNRTIAAAGGCPVPNFQPSGANAIQRRWNTTLNNNILTMAVGAAARIDEVETVILESYNVWADVGTGLNRNSFAGLTRVNTVPGSPPGSNDCISTDGVNTICFAQSASFTTGVLAFTASRFSDAAGQVLGPQTSTGVGHILDSDILFHPTAFTFATPNALTANQTAFDLESVMIHEMGHFLGFSHSSILRAMMYPFAPPRGQFTGDRPTAGNLTGPLSEDDRAGLRVIYPNPNDPNKGTISGRILAANPVLSVIGSGSSAVQPVGTTMTGIWGTHVVAVDADTGEAVAGTLGGWSCKPASPPTVFDGFFIIEGLPVTRGVQQNFRSYKLFVEPMDEPTSAGNIIGALADVCRQDVAPACTEPRVQGSPVINTNFTTKIKP